MSPTVIHQIDKKTSGGLPRRHARTNALRNAQVMPPYRVDLTLSPSVADDIHLPAHVSGSDLSKGIGSTSADAEVRPGRR